MLKNRFFKSTQGVPYELAVSTTALSNVTADVTTSFTSLAAGSPSNGDFYLLRQNPSTGVVTAAKNSAAAEIFRTGAYKGWPHQLAWCVNSANKQFYLTSQFIPEKCDPMEEYTASNAVAQVSTMASNVIPTGVNQELFFKLIETTPGNIPLPSWEYTVLLTPSVTEAQAWTTITAAITAAKDNEWFTATAGSNGITITGNSTNAFNIGRTFKLVATLSPTKSDPIDYGVTFTTTYTTPASLGVGTTALAEDMFTEALVRQGIGHFYTPAGTTASEFGVPGTLASITGIAASNLTAKYNIFKISGIKTETSKTPMGVLSNKFYIFVLVDTTVGDITAFKNPFGSGSFSN